MTLLRKPIARRTQKALDGSFGPDRGRAIVVKLIPGNDSTDDLVELRPHGTRRAETIAVLDVYRYALRCRVGREQLEKARDRKAKKAERLARERLDRAERKLSASARRECQEAL
jgi:hypothetical protein